MWKEVARAVQLKSFTHVVVLGCFTAGGRIGFGIVVRLEQPFEGIGGVARQVRDDLNPIKHNRIGSVDDRFCTVSDIIPARVRA